MNKFFILFFSIVIASQLYSQDAKWLIYPSFGIDIGGAIPFPVSEIPDGAKGTPKPTPSLGLGGQYSLNQKWNLSIDVNYHVLSFTANANVRSQPFYSNDRQSVTYFSGETHSKVELRFVEFPISAYYKIGDSWSLIFGGYYSRILEGSFETEATNGWTSDNKDITDNAPLPGTFNISYNFNDDLDNFDLGALIGYQYKISPRLLFWGKMHFGMKSIFVPEFQSIDYEMYQLRLCTGISYILFNKKEE